MCSRILFAILTLSVLHTALFEESAQYLQRAIWSLENKINQTQNRRRLDTINLKPSDIKSKKNGKIPTLSLTKAELAAIYETAVANNQFVKSEDPESPYANTVIQELDDYNNFQPPKSNSYDNNGYYYYYYPVNSFLDGASSHNHESQDIPPTERDSRNNLYHAHTHQHNVHISTTNTPEYDKKKVLEPLFMAVSSFVGMAVMFVLSIIFLPKFGTAKSRGVKQESEEQIYNIAHVIFQAIEGGDCTERVVCEIGKVAKAFNIHNNRFLKLFKRLSPKKVGWYVSRIVKYSNKNFKCSAVRCKTKGSSNIRKI